MSIHRWALVALAVMLPTLSAWAGIGPTVKEVVEFTRIVQPVNGDEDALQSQISPDREQAFIVTRKANVAADLNRIELLWLDLSPKRLAEGRAAVPVTLLTVDARQDHDDYDPPLREARWIDDRTLVFRARINDQPFQAYRFDVLTRKLTQLTYAPLGLVSFDVASDLRRVVYVAPVPDPAVPPGARSIVVGTNSFWNVHFGQEGFRNQQRRFQFFVTESGSHLPARALGESFPESSGGYPTANISPDGRWAVLPRFEAWRQLAWAKQYPLIAEFTAAYATSLTQDPLGYFSRPVTYVARRMVLYRLDDAQEQTILDAPDDSYQKNHLRTDRLWQNGGRSIVIAGTFLPNQNGKSVTRTASHIIEYWPDTKAWKIVAVLRDRLDHVLVLPGSRDAFVAIDGISRRRFERSSDGGWRELAVSGSADSAGGEATPEGPWTLRVSESLNQPPDIAAQGPGGKTVRLTELNPQFSEATWGTMSPYSWVDAKGRRWDGGLMVPANFDPKMKYSLVIQTYGFSPKRFYRDGSNTYDGFTSGFPGRALLRENILVLAVPSFPPDVGIDTARDKIDILQDGVRAAVEKLAASGLVDRQRVGLLGWSATGEQVLNLLTFSDIPIRAASTLDGDANTLLSIIVTYAVRDGVQVRKEEANGGGPYGASRQHWIDNDPALYTDCIQAALRIETYGPEVHNNWDIYSLLRRQYKPVEMIFIPGGSHGLTQPSERMISLQGNVDWYKFWLNGERRSEVVVPGETESSLKDQYVRWEQMSRLKDAADKQPSCKVAKRGL
ncbi:MAG: hypothetical protein JO006_07595 [Paucibacter sp.]|nr:hypothetical protein [Roseateles sp.]